MYTKCQDRSVENLDLVISPGDLVVFNGGKLWHAVTPLKPNEERVVLTLEFITSKEMSFFNRTTNNVKDAIAYFGIGSLLGKYEGFGSDSNQNNSQFDLTEESEEEEEIEVEEEPQPLKKNIPTLAIFVNKRSGGQRGAEVIRELRKFTGKVFVYDLNEDGGPHKG